MSLGRSFTIRTPDPRFALRSFRPDIEGLRAVAVLLVLFDHAGLALFRGGYVGVDVFFVLSGFLITGLLLKEVEQNGRVSLTQFYARRARRLLPASTLVIIVTVIASYIYLGDNRANRVAEDARWSALFASNLRFIEQGTNYLDAQLPPSPLQHFWSLAVEEQFYAVWPALIILVSLVAKRVPFRIRLGIMLSVIIAGSFIWSIHQTETDGTTAYFSPFTRANELAAGALLAVIAPRLVRLPKSLATVLSWSGLVAIVTAASAFDSTTPFPGYAVALPVVGTLLVVAAGTITPFTGAEKLLKLSPVQWIGKISYSLYLWHWPLLIVAAGRAGRELSVAENLLLCAFAVPLSAATYILLENPIRNSTGLKMRSASISVGLGAILVLLTFTTSTWLIQGHGVSEGIGQPVVMAENRLPTLDDVLVAVAQGASVTTWPEQPPRIPNPAYSEECDVTRKDTSANICIHGDPNASRSVVVYGDSHAAQWIPAFDLIGKQQGWQIVQLTKPACQAADFPRYSDTFKREYTECAEFRAFALQQIERLQPDIVIIASASKDATLAVDGKKSADGVEEAWEAGLGSIIRQIQPMTRRVVVLGMMPFPSQPGIDCLTAHANEVQECNTPRTEAVFESHNAMEARVAAANGATYIDVVPWFCTESVCPAVIGGLTTHRDAFHVAENYAVWLADPLARATGLLPDRAALTRGS